MSPKSCKALTMLALMTCFHLVYHLKLSVFPASGTALHPALSCQDIAFLHMIGICSYYFLYVSSVTIPPENEGDEREEEEDAIPGQ